MSITILQLAQYRGIKPNEDGSYTMGEFMRVGLPFMGGCARCGASVAAYNSAPSKTGYIMCASVETGEEGDDHFIEGCIGDQGYETVEEANLALFPDEYEWKGAKDTSCHNPKQEALPFTEEELALAGRFFKRSPNSPWTEFCEFRELFPDPSLERRQALFDFVAEEVEYKK